MGAKIPECVAISPWHDQLVKAGLLRTHQGKVRDTYPSRYCLLLVATNRLSIFDFVLPVEVPEKGEILTALTVHWLNRVFPEVPNHLVAFGQGVVGWLPVPLRHESSIQKYTLVVKELTMEPVECIVRGYLTGSGWKSYQKNRQVCGHVLPEGLFDGAKLPQFLFTPTTKAEEGHDEHIGAETVSSDLAIASLDFFRRGSEYAKKRGIIIADTKLEWGRNASHYLVLGDEVLTPDSSRFWDAEEWKEASVAGRSPTSFDKEVVRMWGKTVETPWGVGIQNLDPCNPDHIAFVHSLKVPKEVIERTVDRYHAIFERLTDMTLRKFQSEIMGVVA